jgi:hypothetical protein
MFRLLTELFGDLFDEGDGDRRRRSRYGDDSDDPRRGPSTDWGDESFDDEGGRGDGRRHRERERGDFFDLE